MIFLIFILILLLPGLYMFALAPNFHYRGRQLAPFMRTYIAHRGFFDNRSNAPENSLPAFAEAVSRGYGIELDVQMTADHKLVVFHDETLLRMCQDNRVLHECTYEQLQQLHLAESGEKIPLLQDVLREIGGRVPLVVEIKSEGDWRTTTRLTAQMLDDYPGIYCMESFHPLSVRWYRRHRPQIIRGQLASDYFREGIQKPWMGKFVLSNLLLNFCSRPDFIAYNYQWKNQFSYKLLRRFFRVTHVAWTIRSQEAMDRELEDFEVLIFDGFTPEERRS